MESYDEPGEQDDFLSDDDAWRDDYSAPVPDGIDLILETDAMMAVFAATRFERIAAFRRDALRDAVPYRGAVPEIIERSIRLELAAALRITERAVDRLLAMSEAMTERYPALLASLAAARTTVRHAEVFVDLVDTLAPTLRVAALERGVALAESLPAGAFRRELRKLIDTLQAPTLEERHREALTTRRIAIEPAADGMAWLMTLMPAVEARAIFDRATRIAKTILDHPDETRTLDHARADVIGDLLTDGRTDTHPDAARGIQAEIVVTVPALSLLDDAYAALHPAVVEGVGPIPISRARELCGGQREWMRVLTHPETGVVLSVGRKKYRPPKPLRRLVTWRAGRCLGPGCNQPAHRADIDHTVDWHHGGPTEAANLAPLCPGHHTIKHHGGWQVRQLDGGVIEWTSPTGRVYLEEPERAMPTFTPTADTTPAPF